MKSFTNLKLQILGSKCVPLCFAVASVELTSSLIDVRECAEPPEGM